MTKFSGKFRIIGLCDASVDQFLRHAAVRQEFYHQQQVDEVFNTVEIDLRGCTHDRIYVLFQQYVCQ